MEIPKKTRRLGRLTDEVMGTSTDNSGQFGATDDEVQVIGDNQQQRNRIKKTAKKVKSKEDEDLDQALRESGIDITDMTKEEKMHIAQVVMMSKREAELHNQSFEEDVNNSDSEEEKVTTSAFQQAIHPEIIPQSSQNSNSNDTASNQAGPNLSAEQLDELYNHDTEAEIKNKAHIIPRKEGSYTLKHTSTNEPIVIDSLDASIDHINSSPDLSQKVIDSSQHIIDAFSEAVHANDISDNAMEEDFIPIKIKTSEGRSKPSQRMRKIYQKSVDKKQPTMDQFSSVIINDDEDKGDHQKKDVETNDIIVRNPTDQWLTAKPRESDTLVGSATERQDARKEFSQEQLEDLMSEEDGSPIKSAKKKTKKAFDYLDSSDEETQDYFTEEKVQQEHDAHSDKSKSPYNSKHHMNFQSNISDPVIESETVPKDFYQFPSLKRHYRNVKKQSHFGSSVFAPAQSSPSDYTKAVFQLFSLYHLKLSQIQRLSKKMIPWSTEPVKVGYHLEHTLDVRQRGHNYEPIDDGDSTQPGTSVVGGGEDIKETVQKSQAKLFTLKVNKDHNIRKEDPQKDTDAILETFINKPQRLLRSTRKNNDMQQNVAEVAEDFESLIPVNGSSTKQKGLPGRKRKIYDDSDNKFGPIYEDDDFESITKAVQRPRRTVRIKQDSSSNQADNLHMKEPAAGKSFQRHASDLSTGSIDSMKSEDIDILLNPVRPPSRTNERSLDGLSQNSDVLLDSQGHLYSTQMCAMKEKRAKTPKNQKASFDLNSEEDSVQSTSYNHINEDVPNTTTGVSQSKVEQWKVKPLFKVILPKQGIDDDQQTATVTSMQNDVNQETEHKSSIKTKIFGTIGDLFKLGQKGSEKLIKVQTGDDCLNGAQPNSTGIMADDIENIFVYKDGARTYSRKKNRKRPRTTEEDDQVKIQKINMVPCPLCSRNFPQDFIENHAADCNGQVDDETDINSNGSQENRQHEINHQGQSTSGTPRLGKRRTQKQDDIADFIVNDDEMEKEKEIPQKSTMSCYVCDKPFRSQQSYDLHVEKCLMEARRFQEQVDVGGMDSLYEPEPEDVPAPKRKTRSNRTGDDDEVRFMQQHVNKDDLILEPGEVPTSRSAGRYPRAINTAEGYSSDSESERITLRDIVNCKSNISSSSSEESSYNDEYDWSPSKTPPDHKPVNKENKLPGGWTLEELQNSPVRSFVPIWKQADNEGFKQQFDKAKQKYQRKLIRGNGKKKKKTKKWKRKRKSKGQSAAKRQKCID